MRSSAGWVPKRTYTAVRGDMIQIQHSTTSQTTRSFGKRLLAIRVFLAVISISCQLRCYALQYCTALRAHVTAMLILLRTLINETCCHLSLALPQLLHTLTDVQQFQRIGFHLKADMHQDNSTKQGGKQCRDTSTPAVASASAACMDRSCLAGSTTLPSTLKQH